MSVKKTSTSTQPYRKHKKIIINKVKMYEKENVNKGKESKEEAKNKKEKWPTTIRIKRARAHSKRKRKSRQDTLASDLFCQLARPVFNFYSRCTVVLFFFFTVPSLSESFTGYSCSRVLFFLSLLFIHHHRIAGKNIIGARALRFFPFCTVTNAIHNVAVVNTTAHRKLVWNARSNGPGNGSSSTNDKLSSTNGNGIGSSEAFQRDPCSNSRHTNGIYDSTNFRSVDRAQSSAIRCTSISAATTTTTTSIAIATTSTTTNVSAITAFPISTATTTGTTIAVPSAASIQSNLSTTTTTTTARDPAIYKRVSGSCVATTATTNSTATDSAKQAFSLSFPTTTISSSLTDIAKFKRGFRNAITIAIATTSTTTQSVLSAWVRQ